MISESDNHSQIALRGKRSRCMIVLRYVLRTGKPTFYPKTTELLRLSCSTNTLLTHLLTELYL